jgi:hypothetical protein
MAKVYLRVTELLPDPTPYKKYNARMAPAFDDVPLVIEVEIDDKHVVESKHDQVAMITPEGLAEICGRINRAHQAEYEVFMKEE